MSSIDVGEITILSLTQQSVLEYGGLPASLALIGLNPTLRNLAFFAGGSGVFHGTLNPLCSRSIVELFVLPTLLFGVES